MAIVAALSSYMDVADSWDMLRLLSIERRYIANLPALATATNSASVELWEIVGWNLERYTTGTPAKHRHIPDMDLRYLLSPAQSESTNPIG